jgi:1-acyl-sn-glycerol-3-phosphate acyltransferase
VNPWYFTIYHLTRLVARLFFRFRVVHPERVIQEGPVILAMNHESYLDPPFAGIASRRAIYFLARNTLLEIPVLGWLLPKLNVIPVDQEGGDRSALKALIRVLRANHGTLVFPEGSRTLDGRLQSPQPGIGFVIAKTLAPVVPMRIFGAHQALPLGGGKLRLCPITIVVGEPLHFTPSDVEGNGREVYPRLSERVMEAIAALKLE